MQDPTGETFDATTLLIGSLMRRVDSDIKRENAERASRGEELMPELKNVWTMLFFTKDSSRVLGSLVKKRDFLFKDDFFKKYPETDPLNVRFLPPLLVLTVVNFLETLLGDPPFVQQY
jgi:hypothetical protein